MIRRKLVMENFHSYALKYCLNILINCLFVTLKILLINLLKYIISKSSVYRRGIKLLSTSIKLIAFKNTDEYSKMQSNSF